MPRKHPCWDLRAPLPDRRSRCSQLPRESLSRLLLFLPATTTTAVPRMEAAIRRVVGRAAWRHAESAAQARQRCPGRRSNGTAGPSSCCFRRRQWHASYWPERRRRHFAGIEETNTEQLYSLKRAAVIRCNNLLDTKLQAQTCTDLAVFVRHHVTSRNSRSQ